MSDCAKAPRFQAYFQRIEGRSVLTWPREYWDEIQPQQIVLMDITSTPMSRVASDASVIACTAEKSSLSEGHIAIYRYDPADGSTPYNKDKYQVLRGETIRNRSDFPQMVLACGTAVDSNLNNYFDQNVFLIKENPGSDHWLSPSELPCAVRAVIQAEKHECSKNQ